MPQERLQSPPSRPSCSLEVGNRIHHKEVTSEPLLQEPYDFMGFGVLKYCLFSFVSFNSVGNVFLGLLESQAKGEVLFHSHQGCRGRRNPRVFGGCRVTKGHLQAAAGNRDAVGNSPAADIFPPGSALSHREMRSFLLLFHFLSISLCHPD